MGIVVYVIPRVWSRRNAFRTNNDVWGAMEMDIVEIILYAL